METVKNETKGSVLRKIDVTRVISNHLIGKNHKPYHRFAVGIVIMVSGVSFTEVSYLFSPMIIHITGDVIGYFIHGLGAVPFIDFILNKNQNEK